MTQFRVACTAISLCGFAVRAKIPGQQPGNARRGFLAKAKLAKAKLAKDRSENLSIELKGIVGMLIEIDPTVGFVCKLLLGNPEYPHIIVHFLNAILRLPSPIVSVEIVNPII